MAARIELHRSVVGELLKGREITADLRRRGDNIALAAGPGHEVQVWTGRRRARVTVRTTTPDAAAAESRNRTLTRALGAGRR